jgi:carboxymethylenebutenolidase
MDQKIINLFDEYTHKPLRRDVFIQRLIKLTGSTAAALAVLPMLEVNYANAETWRWSGLLMKAPELP